MQLNQREMFTTIHTEGALLPSDLLQQISRGAGALEGVDATSYHLVGERLNEAINRSWTRLQAVWAAFQRGRSTLPKDDRGTTLTRERWLLPVLQELGYGRLGSAKPRELAGRSYPISHQWEAVPIHLVSYRQGLDERPAASGSGGTRTSPHSLVQEFLNASDEHLWALVSNGLRWRVLRDNRSLTRQAYLEFDLEEMMEGEVYADFSLFWLVCHQSRVESEVPERCWLERWSLTAESAGTRALEQLRVGVEEAISALGSGFLSHSANTLLRERLESGAVSKQDFYRQLLRTVYRLMFLFVAEERNQLAPAQADRRAVERYQRYYSMRRLRRMAENYRGSDHSDLWQSVRLVFGYLGGPQACERLALPVLGSFLWQREAVGELAEAELGNRELLSAVRALTQVTAGQVRRGVDYKNLGAEELGSVYESLLELHPELNVAAGSFALKVAAGHERKTTGSYYTPTPLINSLLGTALDPVIAAAEAAPEPENALLGLKVCDPACGSGHFLVAAAHRIAKRLAAVRCATEEPAPEAVRHALREVIGRCIYGVDINPMSVELCKIGLWLEALEPGKPLSFLDHHIQCGNSLLGTTPALLARGIPDGAFTVLTGDDKTYVAEWKKRNKNDRQELLTRHQQTHLFDDEGQPWMKLGNLGEALLALDEAGDDTIEDLLAKQSAYQQHINSSAYLTNRLLHDCCCAAFVMEKRESSDGTYPITQRIMEQIETNPHSCPQWLRREVRALAQQYQFFHWHLAFPEVFRPRPEAHREEAGSTGWSGGFDCLLGNPPWERIKLQEREFFAERDPEIATAANAAARSRLIQQTKSEDPALWEAFQQARRMSEATSVLIRQGGLFPLCGRGDINTYSVFAELFQTLMGPNGRVGCIVPSGIASDDTTKHFFQHLTESGQLASLYDFENRKNTAGEQSLFFPNVDSRMKFCLLSLRGSSDGGGASDFVFFAHDPADLAEADRHFTLTAEEIALLNPNTRTCPIFRCRRDAELTKSIYRRVPVLLREAGANTPEQNPWGIRFARLFDMSNDSGLFRTRSELEKANYTLRGNVMEPRDPGGVRYLPLYEGRFGHQFNHRYSWHEYDDLNKTSLSLLQDPSHCVIPKDWVPESETKKRLERRTCLCQTGMLGFRRVARNTDERTSIAAIIPWGAASYGWILSFGPEANSLCFLLSNYNSFVFDYLLRNSLSQPSVPQGTFKQLPVLPPETYQQPCAWSPEETVGEWLLPRVLELTYTAWDLAPFARDCGYEEPPFGWDETRRFELRCQLDAAFFALYGLGAEEAGYVLESFPIVKQKDEKEHGRYRTKERILEVMRELEVD